MFPCLRWPLVYRYDCPDLDSWSRWSCPEGLALIHSQRHVFITLFLEEKEWVGREVGESCTCKFRCDSMTIYKSVRLCCPYDTHCCRDVFFIR